MKQRARSPGRSRPWIFFVIAVIVFFSQTCTAFLVPPLPSPSERIQGSLPLYISTTNDKDGLTERKVRRLVPKALRTRLRKPFSYTKKWISNLLWPGSARHSTSDLPLPPGSFGCPFRGSDIRQGHASFGPGYFFKIHSESVGNPSVFKAYSRTGTPVAVVVGAKQSKQVLRTEFDKLRSNAVPFTAKIIGKHSLRFAQDRASHSRLRQLVGAGVSPAAVAQAVPTIQQAAENQIEKLLNQSTARMVDVCREYTLDIAWQQIIGLDLAEKEVPIFHDAVTDWLEGLYRPDSGMKSRQYLVEQIEKRIAELEHSGPDGSALGCMVFSETDDGTKYELLSREEVVNNTLLLILGGTETSSGTLAAAIFMLGLHPESWKKLVREQQVLVSRHGNALTQKALAECPYLDAVLREAMRLAPIASGSARAATETLSVDGKQIPAGWAVFYDRWLTHRNDPAIMQPDDAHMDMRHGFKSERWLDERTKPREFIPFGAGPRYCLGADLAMLEMKMFLATTARKMDFKLINWSMEEEIEFMTNSLLPCPSDGVAVLVQPRAR